MDDLWGKSLDILKKEVNEQVYSAWFMPISQVFSDEQSIVLGVPNKFFENWVKDKYYSLINNAITQVSGKTLSIDFKISENPLPKTKEPDSKTIDPPPSAGKDPSGGWLKSMFSPGKTPVIPE